MTNRKTRHLKYNYELKYVTMLVKVHNEICFSKAEFVNYWATFTLKLTKY